MGYSLNTEKAVPSSRRRKTATEVQPELETSSYNSDESDYQ